MSSRSLTQSTPWEVRSIGRPSLLSVSPCSVPSNLPNYANQPNCKNDGLVHSERGDWLHAGSSPVGSDQKVVVIADPGIRRTRPPETAVLAYRAVVAWEVRDCRRPSGASGSLIHTRLEGGRLCAPSFGDSEPHTSNYPEFGSVGPRRTLP